MNNASIGDFFDLQSFNPPKPPPVSVPMEVIIPPSHQRFRTKINPGDGYSVDEERYLHSSPSGHIFVVRRLPGGEFEVEYFSYASTYDDAIDMVYGERFSELPEVASPKPESKPPQDTETAIRRVDQVLNELLGARPAAESAKTSKRSLVIAGTRTLAMLDQQSQYVRALGDAFELAFENVQDKRLEWLEKGPHTTLAEAIALTLIDVVIGESIGKAIGRSFHKSQLSQLSEAGLAGLSENFLRSALEKLPEKAVGGLMSRTHDAPRSDSEMTKSEAQYSDSLLTMRLIVRDQRRRWEEQTDSTYRTVNTLYQLGLALNGKERSLAAEGLDAVGSLVADAHMFSKESGFTVQDLPSFVRWLTPEVEKYIWSILFKLDPPEQKTKTARGYSYTEHVPASIYPADQSSTILTYLANLHDLPTPRKKHWLIESTDRQKINALYEEMRLFYDAFNRYFDGDSLIESPGVLKDFMKDRQSASKGNSSTEGNAQPVSSESQADPSN